VPAEESRAIVEEPAAPAPSLQRQLAEILAAVENEVPESAEAVAEAVAEPAPEPAPVLQIESAQDAGRQSVVEQAAANPEWQALLSALGAQIPATPAAAAPAAEPTTVEEPVAAMPDEETAEAPVQREEPRAAPVQTPTWAKPPEKVVPPPSGGRTYFFAQASKAPAPSEAAPAAAPKVEAPAARAAVPVVAPAPAPAAAPAQPAPAPKVEDPAPARPEIDGLDLPKDGLSRQWLEFLNQLGAAK
jgi:ribonuclease E